MEKLALQGPIARICMSRERKPASMTVHGRSVRTCAHPLRLAPGFRIDQLPKGVTYAIVYTLHGKEQIGTLPALLALLMVGDSISR